VIVIDDVDLDHDVVVSRAAERTSREAARPVQSAREWGLVQGGH
jgi:hypothetical protein